jgi:hypothetical protein
MAFWDTLLGTVGLAGLGTDLMVLLRLLFRVGCDEKAGNHRCVAALVWLFSPAWEAVELRPRRWTAPRWRGRHHFYQAAYPQHVWSLTSCNGAFFPSLGTLPTELCPTPINRSVRTPFTMTGRSRWISWSEAACATSPFRATV